MRNNSLKLLVLLAVSGSVWAAPMSADFATDADYTVFNWWNEPTTYITWGVDPGVSYTMTFDTPTDGSSTTFMQVTHNTANLEVSETLRVQIDMSTLSGQEQSSAGITVCPAGPTFGPGYLPNGISVFRQNAINGCHMMAEGNQDGSATGYFGDVATPLGITMTNFWIKVTRIAPDTLAVSYSSDGTNYTAMGTNSNPNYTTGHLYVGLRAWRDSNYESWNWLPNPQTIQWQSLNIISDAQESCATVIDAGLGLDSDFNEDCYVNLKDFAYFAKDWARCMDPNDPNCETPWI